MIYVTCANTCAHNTHITIVSGDHCDGVTRRHPRSKLLRVAGLQADAGKFAIHEPVEAHICRRKPG